MVIAAVLSAASVGISAGDADAFAQNQQLRRGVNILGYDPLWRSFDQARFQARHFQTIKAGGFNAVRVNLHPFRQMGPAPDYVLGEAWYRTLDWVVTNALANDLMLILDCHEFSAMGQDPAANHAKFLAFWRQLAPRFQGASSRVVFEILNEPSKNLTPELWNQYLAEALGIIRKSNPSRTVIIGPAFWNSIDHLRELRLPKADRNLIVTVHYYLPMSFTHQGASWAEQREKVGVEWHGTPDEIGAIRRDFQKAQDWATQEKRPILLGEFGAYDKGDMASRARYTAAVARTAEGLGWSWAYWQWDSDFIVYDIPKDRWVEAIHDALIPRAASSALGEFEDHGEVGKTEIAGAAVFDAGTGQYRVTGSGENIWGKTDAFHFVRRRGSGDIGLTADVKWVGTGKSAHRKACLMVRQGLEADAPYADVAVRGVAFDAVGGWQTPGIDGLVWRARDHQCSFLVAGQPIVCLCQLPVIGAMI